MRQVEREVYRHAALRALGRSAKSGGAEWRSPQGRLYAGSFGSKTARRRTASDKVTVNFIGQHFATMEAELLVASLLQPVMLDVQTRLSPGAGTSHRNAFASRLAVRVACHVSEAHR